MTTVLGFLLIVGCAALMAIGITTEDALIFSLGALPAALGMWELSKGDLDEAE